MLPPPNSDAPRDRENKCLKDENAFLKEKLAKQTQDQNEMYHYLNGKLDQRVMLIAGLENEIALARQEHEYTLQQHASQLESVQLQLQAEITRANEETERLRHELKHLHAFSEQKDFIEARVAELEATLTRTTKQFEEEKREMERQSLFEKNRVKKEMLLQMKETKEELMARTDGQLNTATKRTMMENDHFMEELSFQSKETEKLLGRYQLLEDEVRQLRVKTKMLEENEAVMAKKNYYYQKVLHKLQKKDEKATLDALVKDASAAESSGKADRCSDSSSDDDVKALRIRVSELEATLKNANDWIHAFQHEKQYLVAQQDEIIQFLCRTVQDAAHELAQGGSLGGETRVVPSDNEVAKLAKETTKMDSFVALVPSVALDELSAEENCFVLRFLLEKMKIYQQRIALLFQNRYHASGGVRHREQMSKQLGVELPPINTPPASGFTGGSAVSPLKQHRRMFAHVASSVAAAMNGEDSTSQCATDALLQSRKTLPQAQQPSPSQSLLAMATNQFNFLSAGAAAGKSPLKSPNSTAARFGAANSPVKGGVRKVHQSVYMKNTHGGSHESSSEHYSTLAQSRDMLANWSTASIPTLAGVGSDSRDVPE